MNLGTALLWLCLSAAPAWSSTAAAQPRAHQDTTFEAQRVLRLMGTRFAFGAYANTQAAADAAVQRGIEEVARVEALISSWDPASETSAVNAAAGGAPVAVSAELLDLVGRATQVSVLTGGAFDITAGGLSGLYAFDGGEGALPPPDSIAAAAARVDYREVSLDRDAGTVALGRVGMRIGFGAIGKGYAANRARAIMRASPGVRGGVVDAAGDLATFGRGADEVWHIGIADPRDRERWLGQVDLPGDVAVVTSGDYEKYFTAEGRRYAHVIDPRTALPTTGVRSATVVCPDAELADALATAVFVLGSAQGLRLLNGLADVEGLIVDAAGDSHTSKGLALAPYDPRQ